MTSMIYTKNTSGAIRRARRKKPTRGYLSALLQHIKFLRTLGFKVDSKGKMKRRYKKSAPLAHSVEQLICNQQVVSSNLTRSSILIHKVLDNNRHFLIYLYSRKSRRKLVGCER